MWQAPQSLKPSNLPRQELKKAILSSVAGSSLIVGTLAPDHIKALVCWESCEWTPVLQRHHGPLRWSHETVHVNEVCGGRTDCTDCLLLSTLPLAVWRARWRLQSIWGPKSPVSHPAHPREHPWQQDWSDLGQKAREAMKKHEKALVRAAGSSIILLFFQDWA